MKKSLTISVTMRPENLTYNIITVGEVSKEQLDDSIELLGKSKFADGLMEYFQNGGMGPWRISTIKYKVEE